MSYEDKKKRLQELKDRVRGKTNNSSSSSASNYSNSKAQKLESLKQQVRGKQASSVSDRINTWFDNYNNFVNNYNSRYSTRKGTYEDSYVSDSGEWLDMISAQKSNFEKEASAIMSYLDQYGDYFGKEYTDSVKNAFQSALGQQSEILKQASSDKDYWSQFADENEYIDFQREAKKQKRYEGYAEKYAGKTYDELLAATNKLIGDEEREWIDANKYSLIPEADDFAENSNYRSTYRGGEKFNAWSGTYTDSGFDDIAYDYINRNETAKKRQGLSDLQSKASFLGLDNSERGEMTDDEIATFNYLYATRSPEEAYAYIDYLTSDLNARQRETEAAKWAKYANESPVGASVLSVIESPLKGLSYVGQIADYASDGKIDQNEGYNKFSHINSAIRNEVSTTIEKGWGGKVGSYTYQLGMGMADFLFNTAIGGGNEAVTLAIMGTSAAADTVIASKDRGLEDWQAFTLGTAAGVIEAVTEKIGLDKLFDAAKLGKGAVGYILNNIFAEAGEEGLSNIGNLITDLIVAQDKSEWVMSLEAYKADGLSNKEAWGKVITDHLISLGLDVLGGAISGGLMGGGGAIVGAVGNTVQGKEYKNTYGADIGSALAGEAVELSPNSGFAQRMQTKAEAGKELSNRQVGKLLQLKETAMRENDVQTIKTGAANRLTELGETGDIDVIASALAKQVAGEKLKQSERNALKKSTQGQVVAQELDEENIKNGYSGTEWAQKLGTNRINADVYSRMVAEVDTEDSSATGSEDVGVKVKEISSVKDGKITVKLDSGEVVDASEVDFGNEDTALVYQAAAEMSQRAGYNEDTVKVLVNGFESSGLNAAEYLHAFRDSFNYGAAGTVSVSALEKGKYTSLLSEKQRELAFHLGKAFGEESAQRAEQERARIENEKNASAEKEAKAVKASGEVMFDGSVNQGSLSKAQKAQIKVLQGVSSALGAKIRLFASEATVTEDGRRTRVFSSADGEAITANGWYDNETGEIWIDVNAGVDGNGLILFTAAHELTHFIKDWSSEKYNAFANFLISQYAENGVSVDELIEAQIEKAAKRGREMTREEAFDEVVADSCESFLTDSNAAEKIAALNEKDATLAEKIKSYIHKLLVKIRNLLKGIDPDSEEGKIVRGMTDSLEQLYELWTDALADAGKNYQKGEAYTKANTTSIKLSSRDNYSYSMDTVIQDYLDNVNTKILQYARECRSNKNAAYERLFINDVSEKQASDAKSLLNIDFTGYQNTIERSAINHIEKRHGMHGSADNSMRDLRDVSRVGYVLSNYDSVEITEDADGNEKFSKQFRDKNNNPAPLLKYSKRINGTYYVVIACPEAKYKKLWVVSEYIGQKNSQVTQESDDKSPNSTPVAKLASPSAVGISISHSDDSVNSKSKKFSERDPDAISSREVLANALEGAVQNDIEAERLAEYKSKIEKFDAEEQKLRQLRAEIKELSFTPGKRDNARLAELRAEAEKTANRINIYDKQLLRLEASKPLEGILQREKQKIYKIAAAKSKKEIKDARLAGRMAQGRIDAEVIRKKNEKISDLRAERDRKLAEQKADAAEKISDLRAVGVREKIKKIKAEIERELQRPTDMAYIPTPLGRAMIEVCSLIDTDTPLIKKDGTVNRAQEKREKTKERLSELAAEYENLKNNDDYMLVKEHDEQIDAYLKQLRNEFDDVSIKDMSLDQLREFHDILRSIVGTLRDARKVIGKNDAKSLYEYGNDIISEQKKIGEKRGERSNFQKQRDKRLNLSLSPMRNIERMSGYNPDSALVEITRDFEEGVRKKNFWEMGARKSFDSLITGKNEKNYQDSIYKEFGKAYTDSKDRKFRVSKMQMMQAILSYEREISNAGKKHIEKGGLTFADLMLLEQGKIADAVSGENAHNVPNAAYLVADFISALANDKWAQDYMAAAREFFNKTAKDAINDTYLRLKHRIIARDKNYIPYEVDKTQVVRDITNMDSLQQTINSYGILQDTQKNAPQALIITGLNNMVDRHIDQVGSVYGLAIPVRNFNKIWNIRESAIDGGEGKPITVVQGVIEENWGADGKKFIEQMVTDLQGARKNTRSELERKIESGYIGATFALNLSVVMKQIGSLYTANSELDRSRTGVGMLTNLAYTMAHFDKLVAEVDKYTAAVYNRRQGLSDNEVHTFITQAKKSGISRALDKLPAGINPTKWITFMDASVALSLWKYVKADVAKSTKLKGEELLKETAKRFDSLIENTQSMSDVLHKPEIQKRQDVFSKSFAMFKTDLYQSAGQLRVMAGRYQANKSDANKKALTRTVVSIARSAAWNSLMTTLFALLRYKVNPYRDDEEELTPESWLKRQGVMLAGDFAGYLFPIFGSEIVGLIENVIYGESEEAVDSLALTLVNDLVDSITTIGNAITEGEMPYASEWENLLMKSAQFLGIPLSNIKRTVKAIKLHAEDIANGEFLSFEAGANKTDAKQLYDAVISGNDKRIEKAEALFDDQKAIDSALRKGLRENDVRIKAAARMLNSGDIRGFAGSIETISGEGIFDGETVEAAIRAEASAFNSKIKDAAEAKRDGKTGDYIKIVKELRERYRGVYTQDKIVEAVNSYSFEDVAEDDVEEVESVYKNSDINAALESGDTETASEIIKELIEVKTENNFLKAQREAEESGKRFKEKEARTRAELDARSSIRSSLTNYWKKRYIAAYESGNEAEINRISELLYSTGIYGNRKKYLDEVLEGWLEK